MFRTGLFVVIGKAGRRKEPVVMVLPILYDILIVNNNYIESEDITMTTIKTTYRNIENEGLMFRPLVLVYAETMNEGEHEDANITIEVIDSHHYKYRIYTGATPFDMIDDGTVTFADMMGGALVEITETLGDPMKCVVDLDTNYIYYFH